MAQSAVYCGRCGKQTAAEDEFCRGCGQSVHQQVQKGAPKHSNASRVAALLLGGLCLFGLLVAVTSHTSSHTADSSPASTSMKVKLPCAESEQDEDDLIRSVLNKDIAGYAGLNARKNIPELEQGTIVDPIYHDGSLTQVRVTNGFYVGTSCWVPTKALNDNQ